MSIESLVTTSPTISVSEMARFDVDVMALACAGATTLPLTSPVEEDALPLETSVGIILVFLALFAAGATRTAWEDS